MTSWRPFPKQELLLRQPDSILETLFGGARGPGKTDGGLAWLTRPIDNPLYRALIIRRNADDLSDWVDRAHRMYRGLGVKVAYRPAVLTFPSGAIFRTGHLKDEQAYTKYMGHEYQRMLIEEITQIPTKRRYEQLKGSCRSTIEGLPARLLATTNPGGVGHAWVKEYFVDVAPPNTVYVDPETGRKRIFISATIDDNPLLTKIDPQYVQYLEGLKDVDEDLWKAWRYGEWDIFVGQVFREWRPSIHVIDPSKGYKFDWSLDVCQRFIAFDWGYRDPGCALWMAVTPENKYGIRRVYVYRELYQTGKHPEEWADEIKLINSVDPVSHIILPHDCFNKENGDSIADIFKRVTGLFIKPGKTLERGARLNRLALTHRSLSIAEDGKPYMQVHPNCHNLIRTLPSLVYDDNKPEDLDTTGEDHSYDAMSLGLLMEAPSFGKSGALARGIKAGTPKPTWNVNSEGEIKTGDFWTEHKEKLGRANKAPKW